MQNNNHPQMPLRMLRYLTDIAFAYPDQAIGQYLVYIGQKPLSMGRCLEMPGLRYEYELIDMRQVDCRDLLRQNNPDALVLAILCDFKDQEPRLVVRLIVQRLHELLKDDEKGLREYFGMLEILSSNRDLQKVVNEEEQMLSAMKLSDLPSYQQGWQAGLIEGEQKGEQRGERRGERRGEQRGEQIGLHKGLESLLFRQLRKKFGELPEAVKQRLREASNEQLELWAEQILNAEALEEVFSQQDGQ